MKNRNEIEILLSELEYRLQKNNTELAASPAGCLHQLHGNGVVQYQQALHTDDGRCMRKLITQDSHLVKSLARKVYLEKEAQILESDIRMIRQILERYMNPDAESVLRALPKRFQNLPQDWFWYNSPEAALQRELDEWTAAPYEQSTYKPEHKNKRTSRGLMVRSMGEVVCAERFYHHELYFRYEEVLRIGDYEFAPDFKFKRRRDCKIIYWEHCGKPYDPDYMQRHKWKLSMYETVGIVPWDNLIVTYSDRNNNSDVQIIESEIINKLL